MKTDSKRMIKKAVDDIYCHLELCKTYETLCFANEKFEYAATQMKKIQDFLGTGTSCELSSEHLEELLITAQLAEIMADSLSMCAVLKRRESKNKLS